MEERIKKYVLLEALTAKELSEIVTDELNSEHSDFVLYGNPYSSVVVEYEDGEKSEYTVYCQAMVEYGY